MTADRLRLRDRVVTIRPIDLPASVSVPALSIPAGTEGTVTRSTRWSVQVELDGFRDRYFDRPFTIAALPQGNGIVEKKS